ncbi:hypothetical protein M758_3G020000 [Ceratodon purpureus]|uniref:Expansin n=1 Tax=Ceratodon purpureus TaxID=3225 RepID=A0A8T0IGH1_CERPU|nr:hypothetical protein KC19_3G019900 [Ceratodon purpureus]KAG0581917.1 hypothetical protein KC19_3G019900 [Ceratodon purpureus]KAG0621440.1 hypothetical protein M758_3G020000 [Ceratodon purpureus]KAG0621441.1 hypothetical protein M758_3G020000 [Ceratodon purpureus]
MKMGATSGMMIKLAVAVLAVALMLPSSVLGASRWGYAHITFYGTPNGGGQASRGACGYQNTYALGYGAMTAALSSPLYKGGAACGACFELKCIRIRESRSAKNWCWSYSRSITITATNLCPPGSTGGWCNPPKHHFDLSYPAYATLARREGGVAPVNYRRVPCRKRGGVRFTVGGNPWFFMILIHNIAGAGDVRSVKIMCPYTGWVPMYRNWGALWTVRKQMRGPLSFAITTSDGRTIISRNAVGNYWKFGQTWEGRAQFRAY